MMMMMKTCEFYCANSFKLRDDLNKTDISFNSYKNAYNSNVSTNEPQSESQSLAAATMNCDLCFQNASTLAVNNFVD